MIYYILVTDWVPETWVLEVPWRKMGLRQVQQGFSSSFAKFWAYLLIIQTLKNHQIRGKNEEKPC